MIQAIVPSLIRQNLFPQEAAMGLVHTPPGICECSNGIGGMASEESSSCLDSPLGPAASELSYSACLDAKWRPGRGVH